jgi:putative hemolysin
VLLDDPQGGIRDPCVSHDASKILFSYRKGGTHHYNLYEIGADGGNLRQLTHGDWDDVESCYLPDGGIAFCSSRCKRYVLCWLAPVAVMFRCNADGGELRMLSSGAVTENTPSVLPDGRILYTRWEYVNRDAVSFHHLWTMNPDGTGQQVYFGNQVPGGVFIDGRPIAGTSREAPFSAGVLKRRDPVRHQDTPAEASAPSPADHPCRNRRVGMGRTAFCACGGTVILTSSGHGSRQSAQALSRPCPPSNHGNWKNAVRGCATSSSG